jgi:hypothetical protein
MPRSIIPALVLTTICGLATTSHGATITHVAQSLDAQTPVAPKIDPSVNPANLPKAASAPKSSKSSHDTFSGVVLSMQIAGNGEILEMVVRLAGNNGTNQTVRGCGAKSADHPLLNWAFQAKRLVHFSIQNGCFGNVLIAAP